MAFNNPASGATVSGTTTVTVAGSGGSSTGYTYKVTAGTTQIYAGTNPSFSWNTTTVANGAAALTATVTDSNGKTGTATRSVTVSNTVTTTPPPPPASFTATFNNPAANATLKGNVSIGTATTAPWGKSKTFKVSIDSTVLSTVTTTGTSNWVTYDTRKVADGAHTLKVEVTYNGTTATATRAVTVANGTIAPPPPVGGPTAAFTSPAAAATVRGTATVGMSSTGGATGSRTFKLERVVGTTATVLSTQTVAGTSASFAWNTATVANGAVALRLTATDAAGKTATATRTVTVSNVAPAPAPATFTATFTSPAAKTVTISVDGKTLTTQTITGTTLWYTFRTTTVANGTRTLKVSVTYNGATATATRTVRVSN